MKHKIAKLYFKHKYNKVIKFVENPIQIQQQVLDNLLKHGSKTLYGSKYKFENCKSKDDFRKKVPLMTYEDLRPYLDIIIKEKKQNILWDSPVKWFAMSSGTTQDRSKYIPVTKESLYQGHYRSGQDMLALYEHTYKELDFLAGKTIILGGSQQINNIGGGIYTGDISSILIKNVSRWTKNSKTPEHISLIADWETKLKLLTDFAKKNDIRALMGVPSWMMVVLKTLKEETGKNLSELWPNFQTFFHGGVAFELFQEQYESLFPNTETRYWETYNASEGYFGNQFSDKSKDLLLLLDSGIYYEFIPMSEFYKSNPIALTLDEIQVGINYALVISTNGGLWRYIIGDTIQFTEKYPYLFRITGRTRCFINAFGEELIVENSDNAIKEAAEKNGAVICEYTAAPIYFGDEASGAHEWLIEFSKQPANIESFKKDLDEELQKRNSDYAAKRSADLLLLNPIIHQVPEGTFAKWMKHKNKQGGQNKVPRLMNDRSFIDPLIEFIEK